MAAPRVRTESGAGSVEHGLVVTAVAALLAAVVFTLGWVTTDLFAGTCSTIDDQAVTGADCSP